MKNKKITSVWKISILLSISFAIYICWQMSFSYVSAISSDTTETMDSVIVDDMGPENELLILEPIEEEHGINKVFNEDDTDPIENIEEEDNESTENIEEEDNESTENIEEDNNESKENVDEDNNESTENVEEGDNESTENIEEGDNENLIEHIDITNNDNKIPVLEGDDLKDKENIMENKDDITTEEVNKENEDNNDNDIFLKKQNVDHGIPDPQDELKAIGESIVSTGTTINNGVEATGNTMTVETSEYITVDKSFIETPTGFLRLRIEDFIMLLGTVATVASDNFNTEDDCFVGVVDNKVVLDVLEDGISYSIESYEITMGEKYDIDVEFKENTDTTYTAYLYVNGEEQGSVTIPRMPYTSGTFGLGYPDGMFSLNGVYTTTDSAYSLGGYDPTPPQRSGGNGGAKGIYWKEVERLSEYIPWGDTDEQEEEEEEPVKETKTVCQVDENDPAVQVAILNSLGIDWSKFNNDEDKITDFLSTLFSSPNIYIEIKDGIAVYEGEDEKMQTSFYDKEGNIVIFDVDLGEKLKDQINHCNKGTKAPLNDIKIDCLFEKVLNKDILKSIKDKNNDENLLWYDIIPSVLDANFNKGNEHTGTPANKYLQKTALGKEWFKSIGLDIDVSTLVNPTALLEFITQSEAFNGLTNEQDMGFKKKYTEMMGNEISKVEYVKTMIEATMVNTINENDLSKYYNPEKGKILDCNEKSDEYTTNDAVVTENHIPDSAIFIVKVNGISYYEYETTNMFTGKTVQIIIDKKDNIEETKERLENNNLTKEELEKHRKETEKILLNLTKVKDQEGDSEENKYNYNNNSDKETNNDENEYNDENNEDTHDYEENDNVCVDQCPEECQIAITIDNKTECKIFKKLSKAFYSIYNEYKKDSYMQSAEPWDIYKKVIYKELKKNSAKGCYGTDLKNNEKFEKEWKNINDLFNTSEEEASSKLQASLIMPSPTPVDTNPETILKNIIKGLEDLSVLLENNATAEKIQEKKDEVIGNMSLIIQMIENGEKYMVDTSSIEDKVSEYNETTYLAPNKVVFTYSLDKYTPHVMIKVNDGDWQQYKTRYKDVEVPAQKLELGLNRIYFTYTTTRYDTINKEVTVYKIDKNISESQLEELRLVFATLSDYAAKKIQKSKLESNNLNFDEAKTELDRALDSLEQAYEVSIALEKCSLVRADANTVSDITESLNLNIEKVKLLQNDLTELETNRLKFAEFESNVLEGAENILDTDLSEEIEDNLEISQKEFDDNVSEITSNETSGLNTLRAIKFTYR